MDIIKELERRTTALTVAEFAELLNCSSKAIYKAIQEQRLLTRELGSAMKRLNPREVPDWLRKK